MANLLSETFHREFFTEPRYYGEGLFIDRKAVIYQIKGENSEKKRHDLAVDLVAMANMSYHFDVDSMLLFGIDDDGRFYKDIGIEGQSTNPKYLMKVNWRDEADVNKLMELVFQDIVQFAKNNITPKKLHLALKHGQIDTKGGSKIWAAYLVIRAEQNNPNAYCTSSDFSYYTDRGKYVNLEEGASFIRLGENNDKLTRDEFTRWSSHVNCPEIPGETWRKYLEQFHWADISGYQEPHVNFAYEDVGLTDFIRERFLKSRQRLLVIEGRAGIGKTQFMQKLMEDLASSTLMRIDYENYNVFPKEWIPVFKSLAKKTIKKEKLLQKYLLEWLNESAFFYEGKIPERMPDIFQRGDAHWLVCLDAVDELEGKSLENFMQNLDLFLGEFPQVKIILTSRPDSIRPNWRDEGYVVTVRELTDSEINNYLNSTLRIKTGVLEPESDELKRGKYLIGRFSDLRDLIRTPLYLNAFRIALTGEKPTTNFSEQLESIPPESRFTGDIDGRKILDILPDLLFDEIAEIKSTHIDPRGEDEAPQDLDLDEPADGASESEIITVHGEDVEYIELRNILNNMISQIWEHDQKNFKQIKDTESALEPLVQLRKFALHADGSGMCDIETVKKIINSKHVRNRFLSLGLFEQHDQSAYRFPNQTLQSFLAAQRLKLYERNIKHARSQLSGVENDFWRKTRLFLKSMVAVEEILSIFDALES